MAKKKQEAETAQDPEVAVEPAAEAPAPVTRPVGVVELAEVLKRFHWHDDSDKTKAAAALLNVFTITVTE